MDYTHFFIFLGSLVVLHYAVKLLCFIRMLCPKFFFPLPKSFLRSMGEWAVVTGGSEGIGRAYAFELASHGMNVIILSRSKDKLERTAKEIEEETGKRVKVLVADFSRDDVYREIEDNLKDLEIGVLVNNVGILPSMIPSKFLETKNLNQMCRICLPGMEKRGKGVIVNLSSGVATIPCPLYSLYSASKVFVERFSLCLQAEYSAKGIIIQTIAPFSVSTAMIGFQKGGLAILPEDFVRTSLQYLKAGGKINGSVGHTFMGWLLQSLPSGILHSEAMQEGFIAYVKKAVAGERHSSVNKPQVGESFVPAANIALNKLTA
ncbi:17-beta-hydroxysteroid dehydrogenase type 3 isoform X2 [Gadus chalcogrammus]|uniref:17-beta-hydroxysteroid dehydrogenase type 3 isoform X2 n=1 Tax=Gadus chalcogrammus TaxID=1042646 RepID=UPI0024C45727|nr:17-beta-hydroxysteroid dehydrogenase type 3 isoform X2 [Gadus chalcogrammus]